MFCRVQVRVKLLKYLQLSGLFASASVSRCKVTLGIASSKLVSSCNYATEICHPVNTKEFVHLTVSTLQHKEHEC